MYGSYAGVAGGYALEHDVGLLAPDLADDDVVRVLPEGFLEQVEEVHFPVSLASGLGYAESRPRDAGYPVLVRQVYLTRVLDGYYLVLGRDEHGEGVEHGGLSRGDATTYQEGRVVLYE